MARMPQSPAYALQLQDAIEELGSQALADQEARQHGNAQWTLRKLLITCVLMGWHEGQTLTSRFEHVREILAMMFPHWNVPASYTGYATALTRGIDLFVQALRPVLQQRGRKGAKGGMV